MKWIIKTIIEILVPEKRDQPCNQPQKLRNDASALKMPKTALPRLATWCFLWTWVYPQPSLFANNHWLMLNVILWSRMNYFLLLNFTIHDNSTFAFKPSPNTNQLHHATRTHYSHCVRSHQTLFRRILAATPLWKIPAESVLAHFHRHIHLHWTGSQTTSAERVRLNFQ